MIPRCLLTAWAGPGLPTPLHLETLRTFRRHHPAWEVEFHWLLPCVTPERARKESDVWRWRQLHERGGVWCDLDIIWYGRLDRTLDELERAGFDAAVTQDGGTPGCPGSGECYSIGLCAGAPGSPFWRAVYETAMHRLDRGCDQSTGTVAIADVRAARPELAVGNLPFSLIYRVRPNNAGIGALRLASAHVELGGVGIHWYGSQGDDFEPGSPIDRALRKEGGDA